MFNFIGLLAWFLLQMCSRTGVSIPIDNGLVGSEIRRECIVGQTADVAFLLDSSGSIGDTSFTDEKNFVAMLISHLTIGANATRVALVQYSGDSETVFRFSTFYDSRVIQETVKKLPFLTGTTRTGNALAHAQQDVFVDARPDPLVPRVAVVITDGQSQDSVQSASQSLRATGVQIYAVGITDLVDTAELAQITGSEANVFLVRRSENLDETLAKKILGEMCKTIIQGGTTDIKCLSDRIGVEASTRNPFEGHVFIKGHYHNPECVVSGADFANPFRVGITVPFGACDVNRYRSLNPRGVFVETVVVFSFHPFFITKVDQAIRVQCFYMEADKTVDTPLEVSMLTTALVTKNVPMPVCTYTIRTGSIEGPIASIVNVGDAVFHRWDCVQDNENIDLYGMLVHSCYVDDGQGTRVPLFDKTGCGLDVFLLNTPSYNTTTLRQAFTESHAFKYADRSTLYFTCQVTLCLKIDDSCSAITPPTCSNNSTAIAHRGKREQFGADLEILDVRSTALTVLDLSGAQEPQKLPLKDDYSTVVLEDDRDNKKCLSYSAFGVIVGIILLTLVATSTGAFILYRKWLTEQDSPHL